MNEIKRMTATERETLGALSVADQIVTTAIRNLPPERYRLIRNMRRDLRLVETLLEKILKNYIHTIPPEQQRSYINTLRDTCYTTGTKCGARNGSRQSDDEYGMYLTFSQINGLLEGCREKCHMCGLDTEGIRRCSLRKVFDEIPNDAPDSDGSDCPYYRII